MNDDTAAMIAGFSDAERLHWRALFGEWPPGTRALQLARLRLAWRADAEARALRRAEALFKRRVRELADQAAA